ncbi:hypothetical protein B1H29_00965 [Streptomyces pactum]|uniref:Transposase Helix-turn-helix domain-containing protein n=1 Tax=Streptomyces pactum TaxID=68249 RepID=A0A1S6J1S2_9ACTN|nr:hypothetical protein B1H29_00965 [Streptomyces pactum]
MAAPLAEQVLLVAVYYPTNLTMRQLAPLFDVPPTTVCRVNQRQGPLLALEPARASQNAVERLCPRPRRAQLLPDEELRDPPPLPATRRRPPPPRPGRRPHAQPHPRHVITRPNTAPACLTTAFCDTLQPQPGELGTGVRVLPLAAPHGPSCRRAAVRGLGPRALRPAPVRGQGFQVRRKEAMRAAVQRGLFSSWASAVSCSRVGLTGMLLASRYMTAAAQATVRLERSSQRQRPRVWTRAAARA